MALKVIIQQPNKAPDTITVEVDSTIKAEDLINFIKNEFNILNYQDIEWNCYSENLKRNLNENEKLSQNDQITMKLKINSSTQPKQLHYLTSNIMEKTLINFKIQDKRIVSFCNNESGKLFSANFKKYKQLQEVVDFIFYYMKLSRSDGISIKLISPKLFEDSSQNRLKTLKQLYFGDIENIDVVIENLNQTQNTQLTTQQYTMYSHSQSPSKQSKYINKKYELFEDYGKKIQYPDCKQHSDFKISHIKMDNDQLKLACEKCLEQKNFEISFYQLANKYNQKLKSFMESINQKQIVDQLKQTQHFICQIFENLIDSIILKFEEAQNRILPQIPQDKYLYQFNNKEISQIIKFIQNEQQIELEIQKLQNHSKKIEKWSENIQNLVNKFNQIFLQEMPSVPRFGSFRLKANEPICNMRQSLNFNQIKQTLIKVQQNKLEKGKKLTNITLLIPKLTHYEVSIPSQVTLEQFINSMYEWLELNKGEASIDAFVDRKPFNNYPKDGEKTIEDLNLKDDQTLDLQVRYIGQPLKIFNK